MGIWRPHNGRWAKSLKVHRTPDLASRAVGAWTSFDGLTLVEEETTSHHAFLRADGQQVQVTRAGLYEFTGCIHARNTSTKPLPAADDKKFLGRIRINGTTEARCSQRQYDGPMASGAEQDLPYSGTAALEPGDVLELEYYTDSTDIIFANDDIFDRPVAATLILQWNGRR